MNHVNLPQLNTPHGIRSGAQASSSPRFGGWMGGLQKLAYEIESPSSMIGVGMRDAIDSSGRIHEEFKRNRYGGWESLREELITCLVWGFGLRSAKGFYDQQVSRFNKHIQLPGLDPDLLPTVPQAQQGNPVKRLLGLLHDARPEQVLTADVVKKYMPSTTVAQQDAQKHVLSLLENTAVGAEKRLAYQGNKWGKFLLTTSVPALLVGVGIPLMNQFLTKKSVSQARAKHSPEVKMAKALQTRLQRPFSFSSFQGIPPATALADATPRLSFQAAPAGPVRFGGGVGSVVAKGLSAIAKSEKLNNLFGIDAPLSGGRIVTARNDDERVERIVREGGLIYFLFYGQQQIQGLVESLAHRIPAFSRSIPNTNLPMLDKLSSLYKGKGDQAFLQDYQRYMATLGLKPEDFKTEKQFYQDLKKAAPHLSESEVKAQAKKAWSNLEKQLVHHVREHFHFENKRFANPAHYNLLFDLAADGAQGKIPLLMAGKDQVLCANVTERIHTQGIVEIAQALNHVQQHVSQGGATLEKLLNQTRASKTASFVFALGACWFAVSNLLPKFQHWITYVRTGKDYFPGMKGLDLE